MPHSKVMEITRQGRHYRCRFVYDADTVAALKRVIPCRCRRWDPESRAWLIDVRAWPLAGRLFQEAGLLEGVFAPREQGHPLAPATTRD